MKKILTILAALAMLASSGFAQDGSHGRKSAGDTVSTFPWHEGFEDETTFDAWTILNYNMGEQSDDMSIVRNIEESHAGAGYIRCGYTDETEDADQWAISPVIVIPANAADYILSWWAMTKDYRGVSSRYQVLVSTTCSTNPNDYTTVLHDESSSLSRYAKHAVSLSQYAGQSIRIAFHHCSPRDCNNMFIDDVSIDQGPVVSLTRSGNGEGLLYHTGSYDKELSGCADDVTLGMLVSYEFLPTDGTLTHLYVNNVDYVNSVVTHSSASSMTYHTFSFTIDTSLTSVEAVFETVCGDTVAPPYFMGFENIDPFC